ncbi:rhomboid family intramembrane serine protease [Paraburkholderia sp. J67]|uniref:rhomboid family intramembrane serine protease n=1 Tax=Paraburkholderia sp. J67 TaxID=2805435 RepID=UPI002ABD913A|nr:rhomboid family intramembrane serine protease [Paraburkholderia sp. J67]
MNQVEELPTFSHTVSPESHTQPGKNAQRVWMTGTIIALNVSVYLLMMAQGASFHRNIDPSTLIAFGANFGPYTLNGEVWRLLTGEFLHLNFPHLFFNMLVLAWFGGKVERLYGSARFAIIYLFAAVAGSLTSLCAHYWLSGVGASGAIFGVLGALVAYVLHSRSPMRRPEHDRLFWIGLYMLAYSLFCGFNRPLVDVAAHLGGLFSGLIMGWILAPSTTDIDQRPRKIDTAIRAGAIAAIVICGLGSQALLETSSPDGQKVLAFALVEERVSVIESPLKQEMSTLAAMLKARDQLDQIPPFIHANVWPKWNRLFEMVSNAQLPDGSRLAPFRNAQLNYYDDMRQAVLIMADLATLKNARHAASVERLKALLRDAQAQESTAMSLTLNR